MKNFAGFLAALGLVAGASMPAVALETVTVDGTEVTRIVIAPPQNELARTIKSGLADTYHNAASARAYRDAQQLYYFYGARHFEPLWLTEDADGKVTFSPAAQSIIEVFREAALTGLRPADYLTDEIDLSLAGTDPKALAGLETAFSAATMRYTNDTHSGRIDPHRVSGYIDQTPKPLDETRLLLELATSDDPGGVLRALEPQHREFQALKAALADFHTGKRDEPVVIPDGRTLRLGMRDDRVPLLRERLKVEVPEVDADIYDEAVVAAIEAFQTELGLTIDGIAGPATVAALNGGSATSRADIIANMERWRWMPEDVGDFRVVVNVPEFRLAIMKGEDVMHTTRVVVGKPSNQTPIFSDEIEHVVVNPYWNVPRSIATKEIGPQLVANPGYLASHNMELLYGGKIVNAAAVDWSATDVGDFSIRQRPGRGNALGNVKFLFPNRHDVYLHDTPSKPLFERSYRAFSHGCVRVHNPMEFADALLRYEPNLSAATLEAMYGPSERWVNLKTHIPVHLTYFTLRIDQDGTIRSYGDVYGHNKKLIALLGE